VKVPKISHSVSIGSELAFHCHREQDSMRVALIQLEANDRRWTIQALPDLLAAADGADLAVLPEAMPFDYPNRLGIQKAKENLRKIDWTGAFIAGGYVRYTNTTRNTQFLVHDGQVKGEYSKRNWGDGDPRNLERGKKANLFQWKTPHAQFSCIPLICADIFGNLSERAAMMCEVISLAEAAEQLTPIIVCSYGSGLQTPFWQVPLQTWSVVCGVPVLICGVAGSSQQAVLVEGERVRFGGGGSGVFWPDGCNSEQRTEPGIYIYDIPRSPEFRPLPG
jgi:predicted amidohydrolase